MQPILKPANKSGRRKFLHDLSALAALGLLGFTSDGDAGGRSPATGQPATAMPSISLGPHRISRLICGSNPFSGYSYMGHHTNQQMREYFTTERIIEVLDECEQAGITVHQGSGAAGYLGPLHDSGSGMRLILLQSSRDEISKIKDLPNLTGLSHHGGVTDRLLAEGKFELVHDYVKEVRDNGLLAGVSAHNPDCIKRIADEGWEVDFFMCSFYFLTRGRFISDDSPTLDVVGTWFGREDPEIMTKVIRQVSQPCLAFKILGGGRHCSNQNSVRAAFRFAFENIKPTDGVIVGMFPWQFDEVTANTEYTAELGRL